MSEQSLPDQSRSLDLPTEPSAAGIVVVEQAEAVRDSIVDIFATMGDVTDKPFYWGMRDDSRVLLRGDEYPGRGVIFSVSAATISLSAGNGWDYSRRSAMSHSPNGAASNEHASFDGEETVISSFSRPGYSSRPDPKKTELRSKQPEDIDIIIGALAQLKNRLDGYHEDFKKFYALDRKDFEGYDRYERARAAVSPLRHFQYNVLDLDSLRHRNTPA